MTHRMMRMSNDQNFTRRKRDLCEARTVWIKIGFLVPRVGVAQQKDLPIDFEARLQRQRSQPSKIGGGHFVPRPISAIGSAPFCRWLQSPDDIGIVITANDKNVERLQALADFIGLGIISDDVANADELIDSRHTRQDSVKRRQIGMQIRDQTNQHVTSISSSSPNLAIQYTASNPDRWKCRARSPDHVSPLSCPVARIDLLGDPANWMARHGYQELTTSRVQPSCASWLPGHCRGNRYRLRPFLLLTDSLRQRHRHG